MKALSKKRTEILEYVTRFTEENGYPPTVREICSAVGLRSPSTVHSHLKILQESGLLDKDERRPRALTLPGKPSVRSVPLLGTVTAGQPILAQEDLMGYVPCDASVSGELFALKVRGDSMIDAAILDGDTVIVRRQPTADNGEIVVALLEEEATVKRLRRSGGHVWLMPENEAYEPINGDGCSLLGVVVALLREL
ncbi:MAG: transcriptional repressor LexA [Clostridia bacterium]|nr:transcriptional repressor LexA [Clostridia bacterium]